MRVIAGSAKGVRLAAVPRGVRPVSDRAREGLFSSLRGEVAGASVLDLFAGTGALAIEALSRGADHAVLVERDRAALGAIRENLARTRLGGRAEVVAADVGRFVSRLEPARERFDLVLADPPYDAPAGDVSSLVRQVVERWAGPGSVVAVTRRSQSSMPVIPVHWLVSRRLEYGDTAVLLIRPDPREA
jgi:16S rRNA (guanine966-N2)-methyltransferase